KILVRIEDDPMPGSFQFKPDREQFWIVKMIKVRIQRPGLFMHQPRRCCHTTQTPAPRRPGIDEANAINLAVALAVGHHKGDVMARSRQSSALLAENPDIVARMNR